MACTCFKSYQEKQLLQRRYSQDQNPSIPSLAYVDSLLSLTEHLFVEPVRQLPLLSQGEGWDCRVATQQHAHSPPDWICLASGFPWLTFHSLFLLCIQSVEKIKAGQAPPPSLAPLSSYMQPRTTVTHWWHAFFGIWRRYFTYWLPWWLRWLRICLWCRRSSFDLWFRKILQRREWLSTPVYLPGKFHGQRDLAGYSPWGHKESDMTKRLTHYLIHRSRVISVRL